MFETNEIRILIIKDNAAHSILEKNKQYAIQASDSEAAGLALLQSAKDNNKPFGLVIINIQHGENTNFIDKVKELDSDIQILAILENNSKLEKNYGEIANYLLIQKPFLGNELSQAVLTLAEKWQLKMQVQSQLVNFKNTVKHRTFELEEALSLTKETLESTPVGIIVIKDDKKIIIYNKKFLTMWCQAEYDMKGIGSDELFLSLSKQVDDEKFFLEKINGFIEKPEELDQAIEFKLKNEKVLELYVHPHYIKTSIKGVVLSFKDVTHRKHLEKQLVYQATHDSLTSLPTRILLDDRVQQAIAHAKREGHFISVMMVDLDNFKDVNDTFGHAAGDMLLKLVSERLIYSVREIDTVIRLGGDEFVVILTSLKRAEDSTKKARTIVEKFLQPFQIEDQAITVTTSIGISYYPDDGSDANTLLKNADAALYHAKKMGRNTFQVYMSEYNEQQLERAELNTDVTNAIENNEFVLHYLPIVKSDTGQILGLEALLRWNHPKLGLLYPNSFIALAEETGLIIPIGDWVLKTAMRQLKKWQEEINPELILAINVSGFQFAQKNFVDKVKSVLLETEIESSKVELEMCQNSIFKNVSETSQKMLELKELGVKLAIDDFGIGDASFAYLKYFPFDKVKIDRSYIKGVGKNKFDDAIVETIISMTNKMDIEVLAEGVETEEQVEFLMRCEEHQVQGYFFSSPLDINNCTELLASKKSLIEKY